MLLHDSSWYLRCTKRDRAEREDQREIVIVLSREGDLIDLAVKADVIKKCGAWYAYEGSKIGQGRDNAKKYLKENPVIMNVVDIKVREYFNFPTDNKQAESIA